MLKEKLKKTFLDLIKINEVYPNEKEIIKYAENRLRDEGIPCLKDSFRNLIIKIPGKGDPVMLSTHLDIPESAPNIKYKIKKDIIISDGSSILGADPKTGLAILIEFLIYLAKTDPKSHLPVEVVFTRGEETGLLGAKALDYSLIESKLGLVLDEDGPVTSVVTQAPSFVGIDAKIFGKAAHPRNPKDGINALQAAVAALSNVPPGYSTEGVTWNVGLFNSGTAPNTIPGEATLKAELRSFDSDLVVSEGKRIEKIFHQVCQKYKARCEFNQEPEYVGYKLETKHTLFKKLGETFNKLTLKPDYYPTFGGSDANVFNQHGIVSVPIGSGYYNAHQYTEYANLNDMVEIFKFLGVFVSK